MCGLVDSGGVGYWNPMPNFGISIFTLEFHLTLVVGTVKPHNPKQSWLKAEAYTSMIFFTTWTCGTGTSVANFRLLQNTQKSSILEQMARGIYFGIALHTTIAAAL